MTGVQTCALPISVRIEDWSGTSAESVSKKTKQPSSKTKAELANEERKNWSEFFFLFWTVRKEDWSFRGWY